MKVSDIMYDNGYINIESSTESENSSSENLVHVIYTKCPYCGRTFAYKESDVKQEYATAMRCEKVKNKKEKEYYRLKYTLNKVKCTNCNKEVGISWTKEKIDWFEKVDGVDK